MPMHIQTSSRSGASCDSPSLEKIVDLKMNASSLAAIGEYPLDQIFSELQYVKNLEATGSVRIIKKPSDVACSLNPRHYRPGAIMTVEGATNFALGLDKINLLHDEYDVRIITLIHNGDNDLGDNQRNVSPTHGGLTDQGKHLWNA